MSNTADSRSPIYGESVHRIPVGKGIYTAELPSNIPDGFSESAYNFVATGDSLENRIGIRQTTITYSKDYLQNPIGYYHVMKNLGDAFGVALAWAAYNPATAATSMSLLRAMGVGGGGDGYIEFNPGTAVTSICQYNNTIYFSSSASPYVSKITNINWVTDAVTIATVPTSSVTGAPLLGLMPFKDRLFGYTGNRIYYTEIAALGGLPETWVTTNYIPVNGVNGAIGIQSIVPLGNKIFIFTNNGTFVLTVQGEPASWILKPFDSESSCTSSVSAFEMKGIIYYVNSAGVWATNGASITKLSGVIEDIFFQSKGSWAYLIYPYEDGILLSVIKYTSAGSGKMDAPNCRLFYTKLDPVAWTEWGIQPQPGEVNNFGANRLVYFTGLSKKISSFTNNSPSVYGLAVVSDSSEATPQNHRLQLVIFDGGENQLITRAGDTVTVPIPLFLKTKYVDGGNAYSDKFAKEGLLELYTSDTKHMFESSWDMDATTGSTTTVRVTDYEEFTVGNASNLIRIWAQFYWRRCAFLFKANLQSNTSQIKIKDIAIRMDVGRPEPEVVR